MNGFENFIRERNNFEDEMYDLLVTPLLIPDSFWESVKVSLNIKILQDITIEQECAICIDIKNNYKKLKCCNQVICKDCASNWFDISVKCPYCNKDLREIF